MNEIYFLLMDMVGLVRAGLMVGLLLVPIALGILLWRRRGRGRVLALGLYLLVYIALSAAGRSQIINHGGRDWCREWHPRGILVKVTGFSGRPKADFTLVGLAFWPCLVVDSLVWHRTESIEEF